MPKSRHILS
ncbi:unnamed protein product [Clonostachys solani]|uniref:Uncharacterized protein n=1 Tax=Clonostachys solani TaxID=160281 RepID=A0A9N9ZK98_9HYPO|nr:unnamed protein product [Clonostachys solani]